MKFTMSALSLPLIMCSISSAQAFNLDFFAGSNPSWSVNSSNSGVMFTLGDLPKGVELCQANFYDGLAFNASISETLTATYAMSWLACSDDPNTPDPEGSDFPSYAVSVQSAPPFDEDEADRFGFDQIQTDWEEKGRPIFWSGTITLVPGDETLPSEVIFLNMQGSIQVVEDEAPCPADVDGDGTIGFPDILIILSNWGACP